MSRPEVSMRLAELSSGKDNNFNLIRLLAAIAVLVSHSMVLATGHFRDNPFPVRLQTSFGSIAVDVFFIISGFLVTGSLTTRQDLRQYLLSRVLRIYPALLVMVALTVGVLGSYFTTLPWRSYLADAETWRFALMNATLVFGHADFLPGVFDATPMRGLVNGSLWTIPHELRCYLLLGGVWLLASAARSSCMRVFRMACIAVALTFWIAHPVDHFYLKTGWPFIQFFFMFMSGSIYFLLREHIHLSSRLFLVMVAALIASTFQNDAFFLVYRFTLPYIVLWLAFVPSGSIRCFNKAGDYSYGFYIYAFPLQQSIISLMPQTSTLQLILISGAVALLFSVFSWHTIEKKALQFKAAPK